MQATRVTADALVRTGAGKLHTISIAPTTGAHTAGLVTVYDNTAESGTALYSEWVFAGMHGHSIHLDCDVSTGIYVGFDAALANVQITVTHR